MRIGIIGCGNLGMSLLTGIMDGQPSAQLYASKRSISAIDPEIFKHAKLTTDNEELIANSDLLVLALKPFTILPFLEEYGELIKPGQHTVISVATGITLSEISSKLDPEIAIYRAMPNTASSVNESITMIAAGTNAIEKRNEVTAIFQTVGEVIYIEESLMESATILGACGIAYVLRFMRAMIQGGIEVGFDALTAQKIVAQTIKGAAELVIENRSHPEAEIDKVTTPKGCTIVGLNEMEHAGFSSALIKGIVASYKKIER